MSDADRQLMRRAIELARRGHGTTWPNPMVGAVVARDDRIIGEGWHRRAGGPHGEVDALARCTEDPAGATVVVTLEPCCHQGRTGPCSVALIEAGVARVVAGTTDPNPAVAGHGLEALRAAGVEVVCPVLPRECAELNESYLTARARRRPHVTLKSATDLFGRTATRTGESQWITSEAARRHAHGVRATCQAIAVGSGTALADDPRLTARRDDGAVTAAPVRVLFDGRRRVPASAALFADDGARVIVYTTERGRRTPRVPAPEHRPVEIVACGDGPHVDLTAALADLYEREIVDLLVEGGATLAGALVDRGLVDKVMRYVAGRVIGGDEAPGAVRGAGVERLAQTPVMEFVETRALGPDLLIVARRPLEVSCSPD